MYARFGVAAQPAIAIVRPDGDVEMMFGAADEAVVDQAINAALDA